jgi:hypothetical protein
VVVEAAGDILGVGRVDGLGHVEDLGLPGILPAGFGPEQALISDSEHHQINYQQLSNIIKANTQINTHRHRQPPNPKYHQLRFSAANA